MWHRSEVERDDLGDGAAFLLQERDVVLEAFADETIAVHLGTGRYFSIDLIGAETLVLLATGSELGTVIAHLAARYDAEPAVVGDAVTEFVRRLLDEGLILPAQGRRSKVALPPPVRASVTFSAPTVSVYSDMEDLLLLDPIHDVDETGWPVRIDACEDEPGASRDAG
jgi:hypothetical protein